MESTAETSLSLKGRARLDNCVTVLDAAELFLNLDSIQSLQVRWGCNIFDTVRDFSTSVMLHRIKIKLQLKKMNAI